MSFNDDDSSGKILWSILALLLAIPAWIYSGYIFSELWGWFIVPLGVKAIGTAHAMGLSIAVSFPFLGHYVSSQKSSKNDDIGMGTLIRIVVGVTILWLAGYIIYLNM